MFVKFLLVPDLISHSRLKLVLQISCGNFAGCLLSIFTVCFVYYV